MSSEVLHEFLIMFKGDTSGVDKAAQKSNKSTSDLEKNLSGIEKSAKQAGASFFDFATKAAGAIGAIFALDHISEQVGEIAKLNHELGDLSESLGLDAAQVAAFGDATSHFGGSTQQFEQTLIHVNEQLNMFATTGHSRVAPFFQKLGIHMVDAHGKARDFMQILPELAKKTEGMTKRESAGMLGKMGIDQATIMMIQRGGREVAELIKRQKELGEVNQKDLDVSTEYEDSLDDLHHMFRTIYTGIATAVLPIFTFLFHKIEDGFIFLENHKPLVVGALTAIGGALAYMMAPSMIAPFISSIGKLILLVRTFGLQMLWASIQGWLMNAAILAIPLLIVAAIAAFALLFDDVYEWVTGGKSLIGDWLGSWDEFAKKPKELWNEFAESFPAIADLLSTLWDWFKKIAGWEWGVAVKGVKIFGSIIGTVFDGVITVIKTVLKLFGMVIDGWKMIGGLLGKGLEAGLEGLGFGGGKEGAEIGQAANKTLGAASASPLNHITSNAISNSKGGVNKSSKVQIGKVEIHTQATDANSMGAGAAQSLQTHLQNAQDEADDGIDS